MVVHICFQNHFPKVYAIKNYYCIGFGLENLIPALSSQASNYATGTCRQFTFKRVMGSDFLLNVLHFDPMFLNQNSFPTCMF